MVKAEHLIPTVSMPYVTPQHLVVSLMQVNGTRVTSTILPSVPSAHMETMQGDLSLPICLPICVFGPLKVDLSDQVGKDIGYLHGAHMARARLIARRPIFCWLHKK